VTARAGLVAAAVSLAFLLAIIALTAHDRAAIQDQLGHDLVDELRAADAPVAPGVRTARCTPRLTYRFSCRVALAGARDPVAYDLWYADLGCWQAALVGKPLKNTPRRVRGCAWH
jgi:hypothetical protein